MSDPGDSPATPAAGEGLRRPASPDDTPSWLGERSDAEEVTETADAMAATPVVVEYWHPPVQEIPRDEWYPHELQGERVRWEQAPARPARPQRPPRRLAVALPLMVLLALLSAFISWVSAEPAWLAMGHAHEGTVTVTQCAGRGITQRCVGDFTAADGHFTAAKVTVLGAPAAIGGIKPARMVSPDSHRVYVGSGTAPVLSGLIGLLLLLLCGIGVAAASGALRLPTPGERWAALSTSLAAPFLVAIGFLAATF